MNKTLKSLIFGLVVICTSVSALAGYQTEVKVVPTEKSNWFEVKFKIKEVNNNDESEVLIAPVMLVEEGRKGEVKIRDDKKKLETLCTAFVKKKNKGIEAAVTIILIQDDVEKLNTFQNIVLEKCK